MCKRTTQLGLAVSLASVVSGLLSGGLAVAQQAYPNKVVRLIAGSTAGGGPDLTARILAAKLSEALGQQFVVENRVGASTMIATEYVARAAPDGYTLLMPGGAHVANAVLHKKINYDPIKDFSPVTQAVSLPFVLTVHPSLPVKSVEDLIALAKSKPEHLTYASSGAGTPPHMSMELFLSMTKTSMLHIPYKGSSAAVIDVLAGHVMVMMANPLAALPHIKATKLRGLGVTSRTRSISMPDIPPIAEAGVPGYEAVQWYGVLAPAGTPKEIVARLNAEMARILHAPDVKERLLSDGAEPVGSSPEEFGLFIKAELDKWSDLVKRADIRAR